MRDQRPHVRPWPPAAQKGPPPLAPLRLGRTHEARIILRLPRAPRQSFGWPPSPARTRRRSSAGLAVQLHPENEGRSRTSPSHADPRVCPVGTFARETVAPPVRGLGPSSKRPFVVRELEPGRASPGARCR